MSCLSHRTYICILIHVSLALFPHTQDKITQNVWVGLNDFKLLGYKVS